MHIHEEENNIEDQMVTITIFISTGRIMVQGKKFAEWSQQEFPSVVTKTWNDLKPPKTI